MNFLNKKQVAQAIYYIIRRTGEIELPHLFSIIYLSDRYHLRKHGALLIGGHCIPGPEGYYIIDETLPPINMEVAHHLDLHPENKEKFIYEMKNGKVKATNKTIRLCLPKKLKIMYL